MFEYLRPVLGRVIASIIASVAAWLTGKYGFDLDETAQRQITDGVLAALLAVWGVVYALTHKAVSAKTNPADAATPKLAEQGKLDQRRPGLR